MSFILRLAEQMLYCILPWHKPKKCFKSCLGDSLAACHVENLEWETAACDQNRWKRTIPGGTKSFQEMQ